VRPLPNPHEDAPRMFKIPPTVSPLQQALSKAKTQFSQWWRQAFSAEGLPSSVSVERDDLIDGLEEVLLKADFGWSLTELLLTQLSQASWQTADEGLACLKVNLLALFPTLPPTASEKLKLAPAFPREILLIAGVNGAGKTTSLAKLAYAYRQQGRSVRIAAGDTFRAAADEQLAVWAERVGVPLESLGLKADPSAVVVKAITAWEAQQDDVLLIDTAGRLHNQANLMAELQKIRRTVDKFAPAGVHVRVLLVLEALVGQNALQQATLFSESLGGLDGFILTKLDSSAKAGMVFQLAHQLGLRPWWVATGEQLVDLTAFDASLFVDALLNDANLNSH
jgi:fused signal recognition particle receptor